MVRWIEPTPAGGEEREFPAPSVALVASTDDAAIAAETAGTENSGGGGDGDGTMLAVIALIVGGLGLIAALAGLATARKRSV